MSRSEEMVRKDVVLMYDDIKQNIAIMQAFTEKLHKEGATSNVRAMLQALREKLETTNKNLGICAKNLRISEKTLSSEGYALQKALAQVIPLYSMVLSNFPAVAATLGYGRRKDVEFVFNNEYIPKIKEAKNILHPFKH